MAGLPTAGGGTLIGWVVLIALVVAAVFLAEYIKTRKVA